MDPSVSSPISLNALQTISTPQGTQNINLPFLQSGSPVVSTLSNVLQNTSNGIKTSTAPSSANMQTTISQNQLIPPLQNTPLVQNTSLLQSPSTVQSTSLIRPSVTAQNLSLGQVNQTVQAGNLSGGVSLAQLNPAAPVATTLSNGMKTPEGLVHSIYGRDSSIKNLQAAFLSTPTGQSQLNAIGVQNNPQIARNNVQIIQRNPQLVQNMQASPVVANTVSSLPATPLNTLLQVQQNQSDSISKLNQQHLNDVNLLQSNFSTNLLTSSLGSLTNAPSVSSLGQNGVASTNLLSSPNTQIGQMGQTAQNGINVVSGGSLSNQISSLNNQRSSIVNTPLANITNSANTANANINLQNTRRN